MRITELVIDGFKSYPVRTVISGWDPSFNAITGLNGSGKSNILDAIAFVLGITTYSVMRASNLQDLIYKRGQAGVVKASVTIVFDNSDPSKSPPAYKDKKEITVMRQVALPNVSKFLLNGHKSDLTTVQNLFQSVQLNINNPNFVIMQGRITKVLSMKPIEILGMVEEAAGTRMFEDRKTKAKRTMAKKEKRVNEITSLIEEDITPKLEKLRKEKQSYIQYQKGENELHAQTKKLHALEWTMLKKKVAVQAADIASRKEELAKVNDASETGQAKIIESEERSEELEKRKEKELQKGGKLNTLKDEVERLGIELAGVEAKISIQSDSLKEEEADVETQRATITELESSLQEKKSEVERLQATTKATKDEHDKIQETLTSNDSLLQSLLTGLSKGGNTSGGGYMGQITQARTRISQAETEEEQLRTKLTMKEKELDELQKRWKAEERSAGDGKQKVESLKKELSQITDRLAKCGWDAEKETDLQEQLRNLRNQVRQLSERRDHVRSTLTSLDFQYTAPSNFDRSKVRGTVGSFVSLDEENYDKAPALEAAAGGKLYQVIIDDERVGKTLLTPGVSRLSRKVTFIPLNKVDNRTSDKENSVRQQTNGRARLALSLVGYPQELYNAMAYSFGNTFICDDTDAAKIATFGPSKVRSVTLEGDLYEPGGTLSGGAAKQGSGVLVKVQQVLEAEGKLAAAQQKLAELEAYETKMKPKREAWNASKQQVDLKQHELNLLAGQIEGSSAARVESDCAAMKEVVAQLKVDIKAAQEKKKTSEAEVKKLERDMNEFKDNKEGKIEELRASINKQKSTLQKHSLTVKTQQRELQTATLALDDIQQDINKGNAAIEEIIAGLATAKKALKKVLDEKASLEVSQVEAQKKLDKEKETVSKYDKEISVLQARIAKEKEAQGERDAQVVKLDQALQSAEKERTSALNGIQHLEQEWDYIQRDHESFGKPGEYDFTGLKLDTLRESLTKLENDLKQMKKKVNTKAAHMINDVEKREESLQNNLKTVLDDKEKIESTIDEIDGYKREALGKTWEKVSKDFGDIFAELLPGNFAKLQPQEGKDMMDGLEFKVRLGTVWKQSLTELSGGQRSLIALSLIMALLQFKPAPMYILDEIDAALDLSHTQHIGHLFKTRFKGSQFIVVSLKEGLFTNANVLFKARFRDGTSIVERVARTTR